MGGEPGILSHLLPMLPTSPHPTPLHQRRQLHLCALDLHACVEGDWRVLPVVTAYGPNLLAASGKAYACFPLEHLESERWESLREAS